jgi:hypothetical protein
MTAAAGIPASGLVIADPTIRMPCIERCVALLTVLRLAVATEARLLLGPGGLLGVVALDESLRVRKPRPVARVALRGEVMTAATVTRGDLNGRILVLAGAGDVRLVTHEGITADRCDVRGMTGPAVRRRRITVVACETQIHGDRDSARFAKVADGSMAVSAVHSGADGLAVCHPDVDPA